MKHTPGPWYYLDADGTDFTAISKVLPGDNSESLDLDNEVLGSSEWLRVNEADLRLMAAAPELLEACKQALEHCLGNDYIRSTLYNNLKAAILKAEGNEK